MTCRRQRCTVCKRSGEARCFEVKWARTLTFYFFVGFFFVGFFFVGFFCLFVVFSCVLCVLCVLLGLSLCVFQENDRLQEIVETMKSNMMLLQASQDVNVVGEENALEIARLTDGT